MIFAILLVSLVKSKLSEEFREIANEALKNSRIKTPKEDRKDSMLPGEYEGSYYHFKLLKTFSNAHSKDIKGFAYDDKYIAIVKRKNYGIKNDFVFVDELEQKIFHMKDLVATEDNILIYKLSETSIFHVLTNFRLSSSTRTHTNADVTIGDDITNPSFKLNFEWDEERDGPALKSLEKTDDQVQYGYGAQLSANIETDFTFNNIRDIKLGAKITIDAVIGAEFLIKDNSKFPIPDKTLFNTTRPIPKLGKTFSLMGYEISIGVFFNFRTILKNMELSIDIGFDYLQGYRMIASKFYEITPNSQFDSDWKVDISKLPEKNKLSDIIKTINSAKFVGTVELTISFSFRLSFGKNPFDVEAGITIPFQYQFNIDTQQCSAPFLKGQFTIPIESFITLPTFKILGYTIYEKNTISKEFYRIEYKPFCLGSVAFEMLSQSLPDDEKQTTDNIKAYSIDASYKFILTTLPISFKAGKSMVYVQLQFVNDYVGKYIYFDLQNTGLKFFLEEGKTSYNDNIIYYKIEKNIITFPIKRPTTSQDQTINIIILFFDLIGFDSIPTLFPQTMLEMEVNPNFNTVLLIPNYNGGTFFSPYAAGVDMAKLKYETRSLEIDPASSYALCLFKPWPVNKNIKVQFYQTSALIKNSEPEISVDLTFLKPFFDLNANVVFDVFCDNAAKVVCSGPPSEITAEKTYLDPNTKKVAIFKFTLNKNNLGGKYNVKFYPLCQNEGSFCQNYFTPTGEYYQFTYPNLDGISISGSGVYSEILHFTPNQRYKYYKTYTSKVSYKSITPSSSYKYRIEDSTKQQSTILAESKKRICIVGSDDTIYPFARQYFLENMNTILVDQFQLKVPEDDYSQILPDKDGCITFPESYLNGDAELPPVADDLLSFGGKAVGGDDGNSGDGNGGNSGNDSSGDGSEKDGGGSSKTTIIIVVVVIVVVVVVVVIVVVVVVMKKKKKVGAYESTDEGNVASNNQNDQNSQTETTP